MTGQLPAYQQVANQLRSSILSGELTPGDRLPAEAELAAQFGVSRSTVREALRMLASRDLVETSRGVTGGTFVARVNPDRVRDYLATSLGLMTGAQDVSAQAMLQAREIIEVPAARLAAERGERDLIEAMRMTIAHQKGRDGGAPRFETHRNFHELVVRAAGNELLSVMNQPVFLVLRARFLRPDILPGFWAEVDADHEEIWARISEGDGAGAGEAMRAHLTRIKPAYLTDDLLDDQNV